MPGISRAGIRLRQAAGQRLSSSQSRYLRLLDRGHPDACAYCGESLTDATRTLDHVMPLAQGGSNDVDKNLCLACQRCNNEKSNRTPQQWRDGARPNKQGVGRKSAAAAAVKAWGESETPLTFPEWLAANKEAWEVDGNSIPRRTGWDKKLALARTNAKGLPDP